MIDEFNKEIGSIKRMYSNKHYFKSIIVGIQLMSNMADYISESLKDMAEDQEDTDSPEHKGWKKVYDIYHKNLRRIKGDDAPKAKIQGVFFDIINHAGFDNYSEKEVVSIMHKIERVVSFRNDLAHNYYEKKSSIKKLQLRAKECLELMEYVINHPWF